MTSHLYRASCLAVLALVAAPSASAVQHKKRKAAPEPPPPAAVVRTEPAPALPGETSAPDADPQRTAWRIDVAPFEELGSGHPGKGAADFDKPDGLAFTSDGKLLATDAKNRRIPVWDARTGTRLGEFGHGIFGGEIVDIAVTPAGLVLVTDQLLDLAYAFAPPTPGAKDPETGKPLGPADYQFKGTRFGEQGFDKLGGIAVDSKGRIYCVDAHLDEVRRFLPTFAPDPSWHFEKTRAGGDTYLHGCEGVAIDEADGLVFVSSERDAAIETFDLETGAWKHKVVGASCDASGALSGKHVFYGSVEGLAFIRGYLLAVDEAAGHIHLFDVTRNGAFGTDLASYPLPTIGRDGGYVGFVGHAPRVDFEDKKNTGLQKQVKDEAVIPGQQNPPGYFCSPDSIGAYADPATGEVYVAVADQCNYRIAVYRWSELSAALAKTPARPLRAQ